jgi:putative transposase
VAYSIRYNRKFRRVGPLFQGRFKAVLHEAHTEALSINRYIHLNPVRISRLGGHEGRTELESDRLSRELLRARVEALRKYPWSSYPCYAGSRKKVEWLTTETILEFAGEGTLGKVTAKYRRELEEAAGFGEWEIDWKEQVRAMVLLGSREFVEDMSGLLKGDRREQTGLRHTGHGHLSWEQITQPVSKVWGQEWPVLAARRNRENSATSVQIARL